jgi:Family of unknown function (DUF5330)
MWFLVRMAFWLSVAILLLPTAPSSPTPSAPRVSATDALAAAIAAVSDMRQFCARQPETCAVGSHAIVQFGDKTRAAAKMLYEFLNERMDKDRAAVGATSAEQPTRKPSQDTLTPADLTIPWFGPQRARALDYSS